MKLTAGSLSYSKSNGDGNDWDHNIVISYKNTRKEGRGPVAGSYGAGVYFVYKSYIATFQSEAVITYCLLKHIITLIRMLGIVSRGYVTSPPRGMSGPPRWPRGPS